MQHGYNAAWSMQGQFWCYIDQEGYVVATDFQGAQRIGVTLKKFKDTESLATKAVEKAEGYAKILEENGLLKKELSQEEQIATLSQQVNALTELMNRQAQMLQTIAAGKGENPPAPKTPETIETTSRSPGEGKSGQFIASSGSGQSFLASKQPTVASS